jgi:hypothetical protein
LKQSFRFATAILLSIVTAVAATAAFTAPAPPQTRVETDQKTGALLFIVNGTEQARIDAAGVHVRRDLSYGGTITDEGEIGYDERLKAAAHAQ